MNFHENILNRFQVVFRQELQFLFFAYCLMMLYISWKYLNGFWIIERTWNYRCPYKQDLWFLCSACPLIMLDISMLHENILNDFQVMQRTQIYHCRISKGKNSKTVWARVTVLVFCMLSDDAIYFYEVSSKYFERFSSYRVDTIAWWADRQMERQQRQKQYVSTSVRGRHN